MTVDVLQSAKILVRQPAIVLLLLLACLLGGAIGWNIDEQRAKNKRIQQNLAIQSTLASVINGTANSLIQNISIGFQPNNDLTTLFEKINEPGIYSDAVVLLEDGTYYALNRGNPNQGFLATEDDGDHAALPLLALNQPWWRFYFRTSTGRPFTVWQRNDAPSTLDFVFPLQPLTSTNSLLVLTAVDLLTVPSVTENSTADSLVPFYTSDAINDATDHNIESINEQNLNVQVIPVFTFLVALSLAAISFAGVLIRHRKTIENDSQRLQRYFDEVSHDFNVMLFETDASSTIRWCKGYLNDKISIFNPQKNESLKAKLNGHPRYLAYWQQALSGERLTFEVDDGQFALRVHFWPNKRKGNPGVCALVHDITEHRQMEFELRHQQFHDALTGLPNRQLFMEHLQFQIQRSKRRQEFVAVLAMEISGLGHINKKHGHAICDVLLKEVTDDVAARLREEDTLSRFSNDEFLVCCSDYHRPEALQHIAETLIFEASKTHTIEGQQLSLSANVGIATYPRDSRDAGSLISSAITAMRHARETGRNTLDYFSESNARLAHEKWQLEQDLTKAINAHDFELHYQPIFELNSNRCIAAEALLRWPSSGLSPDSFIPLAEETGLIDLLGMWVIESAMKQFSDWRNDGFQLRYLSLNLSVKQLDNETFFERLQGIVNHYPFEPGEIVLEITESVMMGTEATVLSKLNQLKSMGFNLAIDDFGTGFSSLTYLRHLPVDILKVDRSFISGLNSYEQDAVICEAIISMATAMGLNIIAEGVETPEQLKWLIDQNVAYAQGFFYAKPVPPTAFVSYLELG